MQSTIKNALQSIAGVTALLVMALLASERFAHAESQGDSDQKLQPVEMDMHEFMEYVFQPTFNQLKKAVKERPENKQGWFAIKSGALILAEGGNLIQLRGPQSEPDWDGHARAVRSHGAALYKAAHKQDFETAATQFKAMVKSCNACHDQFAHGEHQLTP